MYYNPVEVVEADSWEEKYLIFKKNLKIKNPIVLTTKGSLERNNLKSVFDSKSIYSKINPDPTFESCQAAINYSNKSKFDSVVAFGGGSVMDTAKVVKASIATGNNELIKLFYINEPYYNNIPS